MLDLPRGEVFGENLDVHIAKVLNTDEGVDGLSKKFQNANSSTAPVATFVRR